MAIRRKTYKGVYTDANEVFICDTASDLSSLPGDAPQGSSAFVIEDSATYMIDSSGTWNEVQLGSSGGGGSVVLENLTVDTNGVYTPQSGHAYKKVTVNVGGPQPDPSDGKTHIWIKIDESTPAERMSFSLAWNQTASQGVVVDWGDDTQEQTASGTGAVSLTHQYSSGGEYEIIMEVTSGTASFVGTSGTSGVSIFGPKSNGNTYARPRIQKIVIGSGITAVGDYMAQYCYGLERITIPSGITSIGNGAFHTCTKLEKVVIPSGVTSIGEYAFYYCHSLEEIEIPSTVTNFGAYAFCDCYSLGGINIPSGTLALNDYVFRGCNNMTSVTIPDTVTSIGSGAFYGCYGLTTLTIPSAVTTIGDGAFQYCYGVSEYHFEATTPPTLSGTQAFSGIAVDCVIYVPRSEDQVVLNRYKSATNWSTYASRMQEEAE